MNRYRYPNFNRPPMYKVGDEATLFLGGVPVCEIIIVKVLKTGIRVKYPDGSLGFLSYKVLSE